MDKEMVMFTISQIKIKTAQFVLKEHGINSFTLDQTDSAHAGLFGDIKLFVHENLAEQAKAILEREEVLVS